jgi:hypothetical protein
VATNLPKIYQLLEAINTSEEIKTSSETGTLKSLIKRLELVKKEIVDKIEKAKKSA